MFVSDDNHQDCLTIKDYVSFLMIHLLMDSEVNDYYKNMVEQDLVDEDNYELLKLKDGKIFRCINNEDITRQVIENVAKEFIDSYDLDEDRVIMAINNFRSIVEIDSIFPIFNNAANKKYMESAYKTKYCNVCLFIRKCRLEDEFHKSILCNSMYLFLCSILDLLNIEEDDGDMYISSSIH